jgi:hypothetical protein
MLRSDRNNGLVRLITMSENFIEAKTISHWNLHRIYNSNEVVKILYVITERHYAL